MCLGKTMDVRLTWLSVSPTLCWSESLMAEFSSESDVELSLGSDFSFPSKGEKKARVS